MSGRIPRPVRPRSLVEAVRLVPEGGASVKPAGDTVGCSVQTVRNWVLQSQRYGGTARPIREQLAHTA
jgi:transposase-like protein